MRDEVRGEVRDIPNDDFLAGPRAEAGCMML